MFRRNLIVVFKPIKTNSVLLSETNHRLLNLTDIGNSCLNLMNNRTDFYCSWLPYGGGQTVRDTEIGISALVAEAIGLYDGCIVSCKLIEEVPVLDVVYVSAVDQKDWEMLEVSSYRIQSTLLDQTKVVNKNQKLVIWINKAMHITVKIDKLSPDLKYGKIENNTEIIVSPYKPSTNGTSDTNVIITDQDDVESEIFSRRSDVEEEVIEAVPINDTNSISSGGNGNKVNGIKTVTTDDLDKLSLAERLALRREAAKSSPTRHISPQSTEKPEKAVPKKNTSPSPLPKRKMSPPRQKPSGKKSPVPIITLPSDSEDGSSSSESDATTTTTNDAASYSNVSVSQSIKFDIQTRLFRNMKNELQEQQKKNHQFRCIPTKWSNDTQMSDVFITPHNKPDWLDLRQTYVIQCLVNSDSDDRSSDDRVLKEFYVKVKLKHETKDSPKNIYPTVEVNDLLVAHLNLRKIDRLTLCPKKTVLNFIEKIEVYPSNYNGHDLQAIVDNFKRLFVSSTRLYPVLINQDQIFKLCDGGVVASVKIHPETFRYCLCDSEILRENKIFGVEQVKDVSATIQAAEKIFDPFTDDKEELFDGVDDKNLVDLDVFGKIINNCTSNAVLNLCLDERNKFRKMNNTIIIGAQTTGKSAICKQILKNLESPPYYCHYEVFQCAQNKGRKIESIQQNLRNILSRCIEYAPSILVLDNLDTLAHSAMEHTQDNEYYNRVADIMQHMIMDYANRNSITVIATITNKNNLNKRLYTSRGRHLFQKLYKIPELEKEERQKVITKLCQNDQIKLEEINYYKFSILTEGYTIGYLLQFVERAIFYAHRNNNEMPVLNNEALLNSLKTTNTYCLQGIENNLKMDVIDDDDDDDETTKMIDKFPGLEKVVSVFEEILIWPTKYPKIFEHSPLRNQAGILLFGPPGTGKTFLVSQLAHIWNLRMISVKGPELLAKFIGQSEENVRNLFDRARSAKPCVLFFDEFDSLAPRRGHDSTGVTDRVVNQLLTELDGVEGLQGVVVIAATSRPELLDPALLRSGRIDRLVDCALPSRAARLKIFNRIAKTSSLQLDNTVNFAYFCDGKTDNYTGADIQGIIVSANMIAVKECLKLDPDNVPDEIFISQKHLLEAFKSTRPSLSLQDIQKYNQMYSRFMNKEKTSTDFVAKRATLA